MLPWYDERPDWLAATVASLSGFVDHLVAVDGAYLLFPGGEGSSPLGQADAILETARAVGMGVTVDVPSNVWLGNEIEKRNRCLELARLVARSETDWLFWIDSDMVVRKTPSDVVSRLTSSDRLVGHVSLWQSVHQDERLNDGGNWHEVDKHQPLFVRALADLTVVHNHWTWIGTHAGREVVLRGSRHAHGPIEPAIDVSDMVLEHRKSQRHADRDRRSRQYYEIRDRAGIERVSKVVMKTETGIERVVA